MELTYKQKYLLYKMKYSELKDQLGAAQPQGKHFTSFIVTHNGRMRCLLDLLGFSSNNPALDPKKKKFMNCAVVELVVTPSVMKTDMKIKLIQPGDLAGEDDPKPEKYFSQFEATISNNKIDTKGNTFIFYIVRHGDGEHNKAKREWMGAKKLLSSATGNLFDAQLTTIGVKQAFDAGKTFGLTHSSFGQLNPSNTFLFASDLKRTRQTLYNFLSGANESGINSRLLKSVVILPCAHELDYDKEGCDGNQGMLSGLAQENVMRCQPTNSCPQTRTEQSDFCSWLPPITKDSGSGNLCLNWSHYNTFYGKENNGSRNDKGSSAQKCRSTNMIQQAINIILSNP
jgi:broad specificity phosphatase PhoE